MESAVNSGQGLITSCKKKYFDNISLRLTGVIHGCCLKKSFFSRLLNVMICWFGVQSGHTNTNLEHVCSAKRATIIVLGSVSLSQTETETSI